MQQHPMDTTDIPPCIVGTIDVELGLETIHRTSTGTTRLFVGRPRKRAIGQDQGGDTTGIALGAVASV